MNIRKFPDLSHALMMGLMVAALSGLLIAVLAWIYIQRERVADLEEMDQACFRHCPCDSPIRFRSPSSSQTGRWLRY